MTRLLHRKWTLPAGMLAILVGGAVLLGWALDIAALKSVLPGWVSMKPNTAVAFVLSGIGVLLTRPRSMSNASESRTAPQRSNPWSYAGRFCALFAGLIGLLSLCEYAFGWNPGFDQWLFPEPAGTVGTSHPGRMAPDTALCFVLFAAGWDFTRRPRQTKWTLIAALLLGGMTTTVALVEILSYFTPALRTYGWDGMTMMALPTAVVLVALGAALLLTVCTEYRLEAPSPASTASELRTSLMFLLIFTVLSVGIVTIGIYYYRYTARQFLLKAEKELMAIADLKTGELVQFRMERLADANVLCNNPAFTRVVRRFLATPTDTDAQQQLQAWLDNYQRQYQYDIVRFLDVQGVTRLSVPGGLVPASAAFAPGVSEALRSGEVVFQDFYRSEHDQRICLALLVPILDDTDGKRPLGVIVLRIDPTNYLYPFIRRWPVPSDTAETLLVRREGNEVVFLNELRFQSNTALNLRFSLANADLPAAMAALGQEGIVQGIDYRGVPVLAALGNIPDSPWHMVTRLDMAEVYGPLNERVWQLIAMVGLLVLGSAFGVGMVWNRQRVRFFRERVGAIEVLRESEERFGKVLESLTVLGVILDSTGRIVLCNHFLLALTGWSNEEVLGADWFERFIPQEVRGYVKGDIFQKSLEVSEVPAHYENEILTRQGERRLVSWNNTLVRDSAGQITGMASIGVDITERKRMEQSLQASEEKYRTLVTQAADAIVLVGPDDQLL